MALLYHWRRENYVQDIRHFDPAAGLELEQNSPAFAGAEPGERLWAFTRRQDGTYVLAAQFRVRRVGETRPDAQYGNHRVFPQPGTTVLYEVQRGHDAEDLIRSLSIRTDAAILGQSFQGGSAVRRLNDEDDARLERFAKALPVLHGEAHGADPARAAPVDVIHPALLIRINQMYRPEMSQLELYEATRGEWKLGGDRMGQVRYALAVYDGIVCEVYSITAWHPAGTLPYPTRSVIKNPDEGRWEFEGAPAPPEVRNRYLGRSVAHYFRFGNANPVLYVNTPADGTESVGSSEGEADWAGEDTRYWEGLLRNAEEARASGTIFSSPKQGRPYQVAAVEPERVVIQRVETPGSEVLTLQRHRTVMAEIRASGGRVPRRSLFYTVAKEAMLVALHPALRWDASGDWIEMIPSTAQPGLTEAPPPQRQRGGRTDSRGAGSRPGVDYAEQDARNRRLGRAGERLVLEHERAALRAAGREDLLERVVDVAGTEGDGAGYDIRSVTPEGHTKFIEVKTTRGPARTPWYVSRNELRFAKEHAPDYYLYRLFDCVAETNSARFYVCRGDPEAAFTATPIQFKMSPSEGERDSESSDAEQIG